jgi:bacterioferritin
MNQHYNLDDMDYGEMARNIKLIALDEMRHAEMFAERIKELGDVYLSKIAGTPSSTGLQPQGFTVGNA